MRCFAIKHAGDCRLERFFRAVVRAASWKFLIFRVGMPQLEVIVQPVKRRIHTINKRDFLQSGATGTATACVDRTMSL